MQVHFTQEFDSLKRNISLMAQLVDSQVELALKALETSDIELCKNIKNRDKEVDAYENLIQAQCENLLALFHPVAADLRYVIASLIINTNLERCGDLAVNITRKVKKTINYSQFLLECDIVKMARDARLMVKESIEAFTSNNTDLARKVLESDTEVNELNKTNFKYIICKMQSSQDLIEPGAHLLLLNKNIERLADHATNIAEEVIFTVEANIVSHSKKIKEGNTDS